MLKKNRMALLRFWICWAFLVGRTEGVENIAFQHHIFPQAILQARVIVLWTSLILNWVGSIRLLHFIQSYITYCYFPLVSVFSPTSNSSESYWSHWVTWEISHQMLSFPQKVWKVNNCSKLYYLTLWKVLFIFVLNAAFPKIKYCFE